MGIVAHSHRELSRLRKKAAGPIAKSFHRLWYDSHVWHDGVRWQGVRILKNPLDMWVYQEIIHETRPSLIIETGTFSGGSALFLSQMLDLQGHGRVVTVDIDPNDELPSHSRLTYLTGSSVAREIVYELSRLAGQAERVMLILDSDHSRAHVAAELRLLAPLVTPGCYLIVEDTNINGHPAAPGWGAGPMEAVQQFLAETNQFEVDRSRERFLLTLNPSGWLRRVG